MSLEDAQAINPSLAPLLAQIYEDFQAAIDDAMADLSSLTVTDIEVDGVINHDGSTAGFRGAAPVALSSLVIDGSLTGATAAVLADVVAVLALQGLATNSTTA